MEDIVYLVVKALTAIFKKRPFIAFFVLLFLGIIALTIWLLLAKTADERIFPIIALVFVLIILAWYTRLVIRRWDIIKNQTYDEPPAPAIREPEMIQPAPAPISQPVYPRAPAAGGKPTVQASQLVFGTLGAVLLSLPLASITTFAVVFSPLVDQRDEEGYLAFALLLLCVMFPLTLGLGAFFGARAGRKSLDRNPGRLNRLAFLAGGICGLILGILTIGIFFLTLWSPSTAGP